jgi:hypothetical protein
MTAMTAQIRRRGVLTPPAEMRRRYDMVEGDAFTLVNPSEGSFPLTSQVSRVALAWVRQ